MSCPTCHSNEWIPAPADGGSSFFKRLFSSKPVETGVGRRKCKFCGTVYPAPAEPTAEDLEEARIAERLARMEQKMSGFQDSAAADLEEPAETPLHLLAAGIEMRPEKGFKCLKCGHYAYLVPAPDLACPACGRVYTKMEEEAERDRKRKLSDD